MANDWFRKTSWSEANQGDFFARLKRTRTVGNKAQYLRIQACHLESVGKPECLRAAITLLDKMLAEFPQQFELASAYFQKATCLAKLGEIEQAVDYFRLALQTEREFPRVQTRAFIEFGKLVVENNLTKFFDEALAELEKLDSGGIQFPVDVYEVFGVRAIIAAQKGESKKAKEFAKVALEAAAKVHSGFRYHSTLGLVRNKTTPFFKSVEGIAKS
jgi:tetratricopeptide (TPR) repeat protein